MKEMIDKMNACLIVGSIVPKCQDRIEEYYNSMASISKEHQGRWDDIPKNAERITEDKKKRVVSRSEVFETMFDCMFNDVSEILRVKTV